MPKSKSYATTIDQKIMGNIKNPKKNPNNFCNNIGCRFLITTLQLFGIDIFQFYN